MRTGALGGLAVDLLACPDATTLVLVGAGAQAWTQLWAIAAVRRLECVRVYSRNSSRREAFAARASAELGVPCTAAATAEEVVRGHAIVVLATTSRTPVLDPAWLAPGAHVSTVGPKQVHGAEFPATLLEVADVLATDSPAQLASYDPPSLPTASSQADRVRALGALASKAVPGRTAAGQITVYLSVGLAGTEVALLAQAALADTRLVQPDE